LSYIQISLSSRQRLALTWGAIFTALLLLLWLLGNVLTPFLIAAVLAYVLNPVVGKLQAKSRGRVSRSVASTVVILCFLLLVLGLLMLVAPIVLQDLPKIRALIPAVLDTVNAQLIPWLQKLGLPIGLEVDTLKNLLASWVHDGSGETAGKILAQLANTLWAGSSVFFAVVGNLLLIPLVLFYLLLDWPRLVAGAVALVPMPWQEKFRQLGHEVDEVLGQYLRGQISVMLVMAVFYSVGLMLGGLQLALPIGVFTGLAMFVPYVGYGLGLALALLAAVLQFGLVKAGIVVGVVYGLGQVLESFYLTPKWVGERIGLHPVLVIFALMAFGQLLGFTGMLIALPLSAVLFVLWQHVHQHYRASALYLGQHNRPIEASGTNEHEQA
jgi:predicted PurR-regulated permease PerM